MERLKNKMKDTHCKIDCTEEFISAHKYSCFWNNDKVKVNMLLKNGHLYHHKVYFVI